MRYVLLLAVLVGCGNLDLDSSEDPHPDPTGRYGSSSEWTVHNDFDAAANVNLKTESGVAWALTVESNTAGTLSIPCKSGESVCLFYSAGPMHSVPGVCGVCGVDVSTRFPAPDVK